MANISVRQHIRWLPHPASEPTSTVVLTSPGRQFVDVRIRLHPERQCENAHKGTPTLDWAFAGTSSSQPAPKRGLRLASWSHWVDSETVEPEKIRDEAEVQDVEGDVCGAELERGRMVNPATGVEANYEEAWRSVEPFLAAPVSAGDRPPCAVLRTCDDERGVRGMVVRVGQFCQGILREGHAVTVEKWESNREGGWTLSARFGGGKLPAKDLLRGLEALAVDDLVKAGETAWRVIEVDGGR